VPPRIKVTTLESQLIHLIQELSGRTLSKADEEDESCEIANGRLNYQTIRPDERDPRVVKRRPEVRTLISNAVAIFARHSASLSY
jgi:hypothetical protein